MRRTDILVAAAIASLLAASHLMPSSPSTFVIQRAWQAASRLIQGPSEFGAYAILSIAGLMTPLSFTLAIVAVSVALYSFFRATWHATDELHDIAPSLLLLYFLFSGLSTYGGGVLVSQPRACSTDPALPPIRQVLQFDELGWHPGAHYFLLGLDDSAGTPSQLDYARLDIPEERPCEHIDEIFTP